MSVVRVGGRLVGDAQPCFVAAEVGINHNGDMELAHQSIDAAADAGADAVKFQNYHTEDFLSDRTLTHEYVSQGRMVVESQYDMFKRSELAPEKLRELREHCARRGVIFFSTPTSETGIQELIEIGVPLLKNGSDYLVNLPLIRGMARTGLPTVISTGMATLDDVTDAVEAFRGAGGKDLILLHCTSSYPTPAEDVHLRKIGTLRATFDCPVGLSDHTDGTVAAIGAVALGACMIEKHFTLDKNLTGPDHRFSADPREFRALVESVRIMEKSLGSAELKPAASEQLGRRDYRLSCVAARELPAGRRLVASDMAFRRPGFGFPPKALEALIARELVKTVPPGHVFSPEDFALSAKESAVTLRPATSSDSEMVFRWRNDPFILAHGSSHREVGWDEHRKWFEKTISGSARRMFIVLDVGNPIGQVRFDRSNQRDCVISVYLQREFTGRGWGVPAINMACAAIFETWDVDRVIACVRLDNAAGRSAFLKAGFGEEGASSVCPAEHYSLILVRGLRSN